MSPKLSIGTMSPPNYKNIVNVPQCQQKDKNNLTIFLITQKYPYKFKKIHFFKKKKKKKTKNCIIFLLIFKFDHLFYYFLKIIFILLRVFWKNIVQIKSSGRTLSIGQ
jgi:hypothetical protein